MKQILNNFSKEYSLFVAILAYFSITYFEHTLVQTTMGNLVGFGLLFAVIIYTAMSVHIMRKNWQRNLVSHTERYLNAIGCVGGDCYHCYYDAA